MLKGTLEKPKSDFHDFFRAAQAKPRGVVATLATIVSKIELACQKQLVTPANNEWQQILKEALNDLSKTLDDESNCFCF